jgi:hypothetical protein
VSEGPLSEARGGALVGVAIAASLALVITFLALGGSSYAPAGVRDPCKPRHWRQTDDLQGTAQQFTLSALDGTACDLHISRETLVVALASADGRERFADDPRLEEAVRAGLERAIDDGERAGEISGVVATGLRALVRNAPIDQVIELIRDAGPLFNSAGGLLGQLGGLLPEVPGAP